jgi:hypothetical protein
MLLLLSTLFCCLGLKDGINAFPLLVPTAEKGDGKSKMVAPLAEEAASALEKATGRGEISVDILSRTQ